MLRFAPRRPSRALAAGLAAFAAVAVLPLVAYGVVSIVSMRRVC